MKILDVFYSYKLAILFLNEETSIFSLSPAPTCKNKCRLNYKLLHKFEILRGFNQAKVK